MNSRNKKALLLTGLFLAVIAVGYVNYVITNKNNDGAPASAEESETASEDVFSVFKAEREETREQEIAYIESVVQSAEADEATKAEAAAQKLEIVATMEAELLSEGLIKTKLGVQAVVAISEDAVNIVVDKSELTEDEVTQIAEIIKTQTNAAAENIKIMPKS